MRFAGSYTDDIYNEYYDLAKNLNVENQIEFLGQVDDIKRLYKDTDVFCMCSKCEAFGRVTVEAMISGKLVIGSASGGTPEILGNGEYGLLFEANNYKELANKIEYALNHKNEMRELALKGSKHAVEAFDAELNAEKIYKLYNYILG